MTRPSVSVLVGAALVSVGAWVSGSVAQTASGTDGKTAYAKVCESCHGAEAKGGQAPAGWTSSRTP